MIREYCRHLKYIKNIYVLTNGRFARSHDTAEDVTAIRSEMEKSNIQFKVLGVDFDDPETGIVEEDKDEDKRHNELVLKDLSTDLPGAIFANAEEAIESLQLPSIRKVRPIKTFTGKLTLGDVSTYENVISINIEAFPCTRVATAPTAVAYAVAAKPAASQATQQQATEDSESSSQLKRQGLQEVKRITEYYVKDETEPDGKIEIEPKDVQTGYRFGSEIVVLSEEEASVLHISNEPASMMIVGFVAEKSLPRYLSMSNTDFVVAAKGDSESSMGLSSLIHALFLEKSACIVRVVQRDNKDVQMCALTPMIEANLETLILTRLPFAQDVRHYRFPPLGEVRVRDKDGEGYKILKEHPTMIPTQEMQDAMDQLVDDMDLMEADMEEGTDTGYEYACPDQIYNPLIHRIKHVIKYCALTDNTEVIPEPLPILKKYSVPPVSLVEAAAGTIAKLEDLMATKRVETKEERKERVTREKEIKGAGDGTNHPDGDNAASKRVDETPIDLESLLSGAATRIKTESKSSIEKSVTPKIEGNEEDLSHRHQDGNVSNSPEFEDLTQEISPDFKISFSTPVQDFENIIRLTTASSTTTGSNSKKQLSILVAACKQVGAILDELFEMLDGAKIDTTVTQLLDLYDRVITSGAGDELLVRWITGTCSQYLDDIDIASEKLVNALDRISKHKR